MESEVDPRPVYEGDWATATGAERGRHSEKIRQWKARQPAAIAAAADGVGSGSTKAVEERDRALGLRIARGVAKDTDARDADRLAAAKLLAGIEEVSVVGKPPPIQALEGMSSADRQRLVAGLVLAQ